MTLLQEHDPGRGALLRTRSSAVPEVIQPAPRDVWASLLRSDRQAVVSQSLAWLDCVCGTGGYDDASRLYVFPSGRQIVLPMVRRRRLPSWANTEASWPRSWGVGGPITPEGPVEPREARAVLADVAHGGGLSAELHLRHGIDPVWLAEAHQFRVTDQTVHVLDLEGGFGKVWQHRFRSEARGGIRKAERSHIEVTVDRGGALLPAFDDLYEESIRRWAKQQHEPAALARWRTRRATSPSMLTDVARRFGAACAVWIARLEGEPVAAIIILHFGAYAKYWRGAMNKELAAPVRANDLLQRLAIEEACSSGCCYYDMGGSRAGSPLATFKERFGAEPRVAHDLRTERIPFQAGAAFSRRLIKRVMRFQDA